MKKKISNAGTQEWVDTTGFVQGTGDIIDTGGGLIEKTGFAPDRGGI